MFEVHIFLYGILKRNYIQTHPRPNFAGNPAEEPNESADGKAVVEPLVDHGDLDISRSRYHRYILGDLWRRQHLCQRHLPSNQGPETRDHVSCEQH